MQILDLLVLPIMLRDCINENSLIPQKRDEWNNSRLTKSAYDSFVLLAQYICQLFSHSLPREKTASLEKAIKKHRLAICKVREH